jgi:aliphatic sulfonates family ABC transporter substrate-binding protein
MPILELSRTDLPAARARALVFEAPASRTLLTQIEQLAPRDATILITGETGTGKEIVARHVHERSMRSKAPFVAVNCGALTPSLVESELFGHERGAFTGAVTSSEGWFEAADKGTLFLDEVADLPLAAQVKLLRVLQEREVVRVGARRPIPIDVRLIAATNADLPQAVLEGRFREDLYYRLHVAHLPLAPLRERREDILPLAMHFLGSYAVRLGIEGAELTDDAAARLTRHVWPGNIRELENVVHRALLMARGGRVLASDLQLADKAVSRTPSVPPAKPQLSEDLVRPPSDAHAMLESALLALFEKEHPALHDEIEEALFRSAYRFSDMNQLRTARLLGVSRNVVRARLLQYGLLSSPSKREPEAPLSSLSSIPRSRSPKAAIRIGYQSFGVLSLLKATGALEDGLAAQGIDVEWTEHPTGMQVVDAAAAGALDIGVVGEVPPVFAQAAGAPIVYLGAEPAAPEGEAIVVLESTRISSVRDLRGKSLAVTRGANVMYFVVRALEEAGVDWADVDVRILPPEQARAAFTRKEIDAWAIWNPILASVEHSLPTSVIRDARGLASNRAFYVGRRAFADAQPEIVETFIGQVGSVGRWASDNQELAARLLASQLGFSQLAMETALARTPFDARPLDAAAIEAQQHIADTFHRLGLIARPVRVDQAVWTRPWETTRRSA